MGNSDIDSEETRAHGRRTGRRSWAHLARCFLHFCIGIVHVDDYALSEVAAVGAAVGRGEGGAEGQQGATRRNANLLEERDGDD